MNRGYVVTYTYNNSTQYYTGFDWVDDPLKAKVYRTGAEALKVRDMLYGIWVRRYPRLKESYDRNLDIQIITKTVIKTPKPVKTFHRIKHNRFAR
jgi:hypothetical protein